MCGGANNQLAAEEDARGLQERGVAPVPAFVASAGGVIVGTAASGLYPAEVIQAKLNRIFGRAPEILRRADAEGRPSPTTWRGGWPWGCRRRWRRRPTGQETSRIGAR